MVDILTMTQKFARIQSLRLVVCVPKSQFRERCSFSISDIRTLVMAMMILKSYAFLAIVLRYILRMHAQRKGT
jgi:hypothetical protein